jgi:hypothetical protein
MADSDISLKGALPEILFKIFEFTLRAADGYMTLIEYGDARGVIPPILELFQAL